MCDQQQPTPSFVLLLKRLYGLLNDRTEAVRACSISKRPRRHGIRNRLFRLENRSAIQRDSPCSCRDSCNHFRVCIFRVLPLTSVTCRSKISWGYASRGFLLEFATWRSLLHLLVVLNHLLIDQALCRFWDPQNEVVFSEEIKASEAAMVGRGIQV